MKKVLVVLVIALVSITMAYSQNGTWSGDLEIMGQKLPVVFHLDNNNPTVDSPVQGAKGIPINIDKKDEGVIVISIPMIRANFEGKYENNKITGIFNQNGLSLPLTLSPGENKINRPQTPQPPFPYSEREVSFKNGEAVLKGTLTLPEIYDENTPAVLMVTGSGLQNRDEEIFDHKPFAVIADAFAKSGIATLRYDDRGFGESTGDAVNCTTEDLMKDALSGIDLLRQQFKKVGVLGHSEGGTIALMLAADKKTDFIACLAGMVVSGKETLIKQNQIALTDTGFPEETVDLYCQLLSKVFDNDDNVVTQIEESNLPKALKKNIKVVTQQIKSPYMKYFINLDIKKRLNEIECPVLAFNGTKDSQVFYKDNLEALNKGLKKNKNKNIRYFENLNHLFQHCKTGSITEYATIEETISPEVLTELSSWILSL